jgi:hypothetical protein
MSANQGITPPGPRTSAENAAGYVSDARAYLRAAKTLASMNDRRSYESPVYFLLCHAIELLLKGFVLARGGDGKELRNNNKVRHQLAELHIRAKSLGLPSGDRISEVVERLAPLHADFAFRYRNPRGFTQDPDASEVAMAVEELMTQVEPLVMSIR